MDALKAVPPAKGPRRPDRHRAASAPAYGGTMNNKVVYNLHYAFAIGFTVLRFNFRGVGRSQGEYDQGSANCPTPPARSTICRR
jgi:predicted acyl esterase